MRTWMMAASVAAVGLMAAGTAEAALFDFSKLKESNENGGSDPNDINNQNGPFEFTAFGVTVTVTASGGSDFVGVLDTTAGSAGTENDPDLTSPFDDVDGLVDILLASDFVAECVSEKALIFSLRRGLDHDLLPDACAIREVADAAEGAGGSYADLLVAIATHPSFRVIRREGGTP